MRSKSRFTMLVLLETRESATPYSDQSSACWIAPACLADSFDYLVGASRVAPKRWGCQAILCCPGARRGHEDAQQVPFKGQPLSLNRPIALPEDTTVPVLGRATSGWSNTPF